MRRHVVATFITLLLLAGSFIMIAEAFTYSSAQTTVSEVGQPWGFLATTDDPSVTHVGFHWFYGGPFGTDLGETIDNTVPYEASIIPDKPGQWFVLISFYDANNNILFTDSHNEQIGDLQIVPEIPILGAAGAIVAMLLAIAYFKRPKAFRLNLKKF